MSGTLFVVATPIGNLEDITLRALRILREVQLVAAEDTRRTAKLLSHYGIPTPTLSFHEHNSHARMPGLLARLKAGEHIALVTDAGTPGVSDPGVELVAACRQEGIRVDPIPGASAALVAAVGSGFPLNSITILGFPPTKAKAREEWMRGLTSAKGTSVFFEAPHRIATTLRQLASYLGDRPICVARELTKVHEEFVIGPAVAPIFLGIARKGELCVVVSPPTALAAAIPALDDASVARAFRALASVDSSLGKRQTASRVAKQLGLSTNDVYQALERAKT